MDKEEIEKAKKVCRLLCGKKNKKGKREYETFTRLQMQIDYTVDEMAEAIETLLQYIDQLEQENNKLNKINNEMVGSFYKLYQKIPGTMHKFFENGKPCEYGYDKETNECKEINCKPCIKQYFEKKVEEK